MTSISALMAVIKEENLKLMAALGLAFSYLTEAQINEISAKMPTQRKEPEHQPTNCRHCGGASNVLCAGQCKVQSAPVQQEPALNCERMECGGSNGCIGHCWKKRKQLPNVQNEHLKDQAIDPVSLSRITRDDTEHGKEYYLAASVDALLSAQLPKAHPDDIAVDQFATAMKAKMDKQRAKGYNGWNDKSSFSADQLQQMLVEHVGKGDPVDVGNFAMMLFCRGEQSKLISKN